MSHFNASLLRHLVTSAPILLRQRSIILLDLRLILQQNIFAEPLNHFLFPLIICFQMLNQQGCQLFRCCLQDVEDIAIAQFNYGALDRENQATRLRLSSTVVGVREVEKKRGEFIW